MTSTSLCFMSWELVDYKGHITMRKFPVEYLCENLHIYVSCKYIFLQHVTVLSFAPYITCYGISITTGAWFSILSLLGLL